MNTSMKNLEEKFLDYIENRLSQEEHKEFEAILLSDVEAKKAFESYKSIITAEKIIAGKQHELHANFTVKVMEAVENTSSGFSSRRLFMWLNKKQRVIFAGVATCAVVALGLKFYSENSLESFEVDLARKRERIEAASTGNTIKAPSSSGPVVAESLQDKELVGGKGSGAREDELRQNEANSKLDSNSQPAKVAVDPIGKAITAGGVVSEDLSKDEKKNRDLLNSFKGELQKPKQKELRAQENLPHYDDRTARVFKKVLERVAERDGHEQGYLKSTPLPIEEVDTSRIDSLQRYITTSNNINSEQYFDYIENPRTLVQSEPSSTFSIDVDTASYANARRFLKDGSLPPKESIRIEEFINYFDYNYPVQHDKPFTLSYEVAPSPLETDRYLLKLGIKSKDAKERSLPWNLVFLVDVSGSMSEPNKLPLVQKSLRLLTNNMRESDKVAIVTYAGDSRVALEPTSIKEKSKILAAIDSLSSGGSTNGSGGVVSAYDLAGRNMLKEGVNRVVLATDGDFNVGITSKDDLVRLIEDKRKSGITLTTLGFGEGNLKDGTMEQLANKGNGNYYYIDSFQEARKVLETDLSGTMEVVAKDVKLQIEFNPEHVSSYRLIGYENRKLNREDFNNDAIDAGEIGTGHTVTALYEIVLANTPLAQKLADEYRYQNKVETKTPEANKELSPELAFLKIRYKEPSANQSKLLEFPIEKANIRPTANDTSTDFRFAAAVSYFAHILRSSQYVGSYTLKDIQQLAENARGEDKQGYRQEFIELVKNSAALLSSQNHNQ